MMKKMITLASLAFMLMAAPASMQAQNIVNADAKVDAKAAKKAEKERLKQEKKAAKEKAKAAKLVAKDATNAAVGTTASAITNEFKNEKPALLTAGDSTAYLFGISQSNGLKAYLVNQMNVDTAYLNTFARGVMDRVSIDPADKELHAYNAGLNIGGQVEQMTQQFSNDYYKANPESKIDPRIVASAIIAGLTGQSEMSSEDAMNKFREIMTERQKQNMEVMYGENRKAGELFLEQNKKKPGVITLPSGLQYKVLTEGKGAVPTANQKVKVNYEGHLIDGTEFDSSYKRGEPTSFQANQVIKGWTEALTKMPVGSKWELYIPYNLAYGDRDSGKIKPYSALIFTVELLEIEDNAVNKAKATLNKSKAKVTSAKK